MTSCIETLSICRTCLSKNGKMISIFNVDKFEKLDRKICEVMQCCASVQVCRGDGLPEQMCADCVQELKRTSTFRQRCEKSDAALRRLLVLTPGVDKNVLLVPKVEIKTELSEFTKQTERYYGENKNNYNVAISCTDQSNASRRSKLDKPTDTDKCRNSVVEEEETDQTMQKSEVSLHECRKCTVSFGTLIDYNVHMSEKHSDQVNSTEFIESSEFNDMDESESDPEETPTSVHPLTCTLCNKVFKSRGGFKYHKLGHTREKLYKCKVCGEAFNQFSLLLTHKLTHGGTQTAVKKFLCSVCGKGFTGEASLIKHRVIHTGEKPFKCDLCEKTFGFRASLWQHIRTHVGNAPFECSECGQRFKQSVGLKIHVAKHTGQYPLKCEVCSKGFTRPGDLASHKKIHTKEKTFCCTECGKCFGESSVLRTHMRIHTGERPFVCELCGRSFTQASAFKTHKKLVHK